MVKLRGVVAWKSSLVVSPDGCRDQLVVTKITDQLELIGKLSRSDSHETYVWKPNTGTLHRIPHGETIPKFQEERNESEFIDWLAAGLANPRVTGDMLVKGLKARGKLWPSGWKLTKNYVGGWQLFDSEGSQKSVGHLAELR